MDGETIYDHPRYYDILFGWDRSAEAAFYDALLRQCGATPDAPLLEVACGPARVALLLARRGWRVCGLDASAAMLAYAHERAREQGLALATLHGEMERFAAPEPFGAAINPMSSFRLLHSDEAAHAHLRCMAAALRPGGVYALDLTLARTREDPPTTTSEAWEMAEDGITIRATDESITLSDHGAERSLAWGAEAHLRVLTGSELARLVEASGAFELASCHAEVSRETGVSEFDLRPAPALPVGRCIVALRRR
jgi:SAM-dependent methyltransferase